MTRSDWKEKVCANICENGSRATLVDCTTMKLWKSSGKDFTQAKNQIYTSSVVCLNLPQKVHLKGYKIKFSS